MSAAADLLRARGGPEQDVTVDRTHAVAAFSIERLLRVDGQPVPIWGELSGAYRTADERYIQLHCMLGVGERRADFERAIGGWNGLALEQALIEAGLVGALYRTDEKWRRHPHAQATGQLPPLSLGMVGPAAPRPLGPADRPLAGGCACSTVCACWRGPSPG